MTDENHSLMCFEHLIASESLLEAANCVIDREADATRKARGKLDHIDVVIDKLGVVAYEQRKVSPFDACPGIGAIAKDAVNEDNDPLSATTFNIT